MAEKLGLKTKGTSYCVHNSVLRFFCFVFFVFFVVFVAFFSFTFALMKIQEQEKEYNE